MEWNESPSSTRAIVVVVVRSVARRAGWSRASSRRVVVSRGFASARSRVAHSRVRSGPFPQCAAPGCGRGRGRGRDRATTRGTRLARVVALALGRGRAIARGGETAVDDGRGRILHLHLPRRRRDDDDDGGMDAMDDDERDETRDVARARSRTDARRRRRRFENDGDSRRRDGCWG
jgi:hypothetical protein